MKGYYFITDRSLSAAGIFSDAEQALAAEVEVIQYRNKQGSTREMYEEALALRRICRDALFLINDRIDIALAAKADGVHLGQTDMPYEQARKILGPEAVIGVTVHDLQEAENASAAGADYLGVSPIFRTDTKPDAGLPSGTDLLRKIKARVSIPLVAVGGINLDNAAEVISAGADAVCAISAVVKAQDVKKEIMKFQSLFKGKA